MDGISLDRLINSGMIAPQHETEIHRVIHIARHGTARAVRQLS